MDVVNNEVKQKMQASIRSKLLELDCCVDNELPYYVTVMVISKCTRTQMKRALQLFMGAKTELFVDWVHQVLTKSHEFNVATPTLSTHSAIYNKKEKMCMYLLKTRKKSEMDGRDKEMERCERVSKLKTHTSRTSSASVGRVKPWLRDLTNSTAHKNSSNTSCTKEGRTTDSVEVHKTDIQIQVGAKILPKSISFDKETNRDQDKNNNNVNVINIQSNVNTNKHYLNGILNKKLQAEGLQIINEDEPPTKKRKASPVEFNVTGEQKNVDANLPLSTADRKPVWCRAFPACNYGAACSFVHPRCKYLSACTRWNCVYSHLPTSPLAPTQPITPVAPNIAPLKVPTTCKYFPNCWNPVCHYRHPTPCQYGINCTKRACNFLHTKTKTVLPLIIRT